MQAFACDQCNRIMDIQDYRYARQVGQAHKCRECINRGK